MALHATIDFETYSEAGLVFDGAKWRGDPRFALPGTTQTKRGLPVVGVDNYVSHPSFEVLSLAYRLPGGSVVRWVPGAERPEPLLVYIAAGGLVEAWNVGFEVRVWQWCVEHWSWPEWPLAQQRCAMAKSRAAAYPGALGEAAEVLGCVERKDKRGDALVRKLTMPRNPTKGDPSLRYTPETARDDFEAFYEYNEQDVRAELDASNRLPELTPHNLAVWQLDQTINRRGVAIDTAGVDNCIAIVEQAYERAEAELRGLTMVTRDVLVPVGVAGMNATVSMKVPAVESPSEVAAMLAWCRARGIYLDSADEESIAAALARELPPDVRRVLEIRQSLAFGSVKKLYAMRAQVCADGRLREQYIFRGAHTGLWNGQNVQLANLFKGIFEGPTGPAEVEKALDAIATRSIEYVEYAYPGHDPLEIVASCLRSLLIAAPGKRLISADFNAIQAVVTSALAGEEWRLEVFRTHGKIYEAMASQLTGAALEDYLEYRKTHGAHHADRQLGKLAVLSCDFGAWINGWKRFGAEKLLGDDENIKTVILKTRAAQPMIEELWGGQTRGRFTYDERAELYGLEGCVVAALKEPGRAFAYRGIVYQLHDDGTLYCLPPSGDLIRYHNARLLPADRPYSREWEYRIVYDGHNSNAAKGAPGWQTMDLYGGVLTQNVVSHESWMIQALALLRLEAAGYPVVMHTHDENVCEVPDEFGGTGEHTWLTAELPVWARTPDGRPWPIKVPESWEAKRYGKW